MKLVLFFESIYANQFALRISDHLGGSPHPLQITPNQLHIDHTVTPLSPLRSV